MTEESSAAPDPEEIREIEQQMHEATRQSMEWDAICPHCDAEFLFAEAFDLGFRCPECGEVVSADSVRPEFQTD